MCLMQESISLCFFSRIQDVFEWIFEVEDDAMDDDRGRLKMVLEYEMNTQFKETYGPVENKVASRVQIQRDNTFSIVPVMKVAIDLYARTICLPLFRL